MLEGFRTVPGAGLEAVLPDGGFVYVGSREWMASHTLAVGPRLQAALADAKGASASHVFVGTKGVGTAAAGVGALFLLEETLQPSVAACSRRSGELSDRGGGPDGRPAESVARRRGGS